MLIDDRLQALGIELPCAPSPAGSYESVVIRNGVGYVSGQLPLRNGVLAYPGRVGDDLSLDEAMRAAELATLNVLAQIKCSTNQWRSFAGLLRLEGYVASARGSTTPGRDRRGRAAFCESSVKKSGVEWRGRGDRTCVLPPLLHGKP